MGFRILKGEELGTDYLKKVMALDAVVYSEEYVGKLENMAARYEKNPKSFVCMEDTESGRLAGYMNFFPCTKALYKDIVYESNVIRDDDIRPDEIALYHEEENHLFIISIVIAPEFQGKEAVITLSDAWIGYLNDLEKAGYPITDISATAVSPEGRKFLRNYMFTQERELSDGNIVYLCKEKFLRKLLAKDLYFKSYRDDIYLMLPLADHAENHRMDELFSEEGQAECPDIPQALIDGLNGCLQYECANAVWEELDIKYLGTFSFLHTVDDYPTGEGDGEADEAADQEGFKEIVVGEETVYAILMAHRPTHMYVLTLLLPDCRYSTTQVEDQVSYGYLKIRDPEGGAGYVDLYEYLRLKYGLQRCGDGKCLLCMSKWDTEGREFQNILAGEVYNSMHQDYRISSPGFAEQCRTSYAQYDYYDVYLSDMVIAFVMKDFSEDLFDRIELTATYAFIAELVMFQNTSLAKTNIKISNALANDGDISHEQVLELYREFGKTVRFWEIKNFKYMGTQAEAACITKIFSDEELKETYYEHQEFLEHIVELKAARTEARNGMILNVVATILALIQIQSFVVELIEKFYEFLGIEGVYAAQTFNTGILGGTMTLVLIAVILQRKRRNLRRTNLRVKRIKLRD